MSSEGKECTLSCTERSNRLLYTLSRVDTHFCSLAIVFQFSENISPLTNLLIPIYMPTLITKLYVLIN